MISEPDPPILTQVSVGRRNRAFEAGEIVDASIDLERRLASPAGDNSFIVAQPSRPTQTLDIQKGGCPSTQPLTKRCDSFSMAFHSLRFG